MRRFRNAKIVATLGPSSSTKETISALFYAGVDVFRLNFSHGTHADHQELYNIIRELEKNVQRPIAILMDLQGPKLRVGTFESGKIVLKAGQSFRLDLDPTLGNAERVNLPHPEIFAAVTPEMDLLLDDGKLRLKVQNFGKDFIETIVMTDGELSNRKGVNVPGVMLPISALTKKDLADLDFGLSLGVDWVALSFVQQPKDLTEAHHLIKGRAKIMAKLEKPMAIQHLDEIIDLSDGIMVARGDLGVELPPEEVPSIQKRIIRACRLAGKPVVVATQMLDSMIHAPSPTRAEASDVATAIYDGVDAVMLSAESASGQYPVEAVSIMSRIITKVEQDPIYRQMIDASRTKPEHTVADAITSSARQIAETINVSAIVTFTDSGLTTLKAARERPESPILALTPRLSTARMLPMVWGAHSVLTQELQTFAQMVDVACETAYTEQFAKIDDNIIITAGVPFGSSGATNILRVAVVTTQN